MGVTIHLSNGLPTGGDLVNLPGVSWLHFLDILVAMSSLVDSGVLTQGLKLVPGDP